MDRWSTMEGRQAKERKKQNSPHDFGSVMVVDDEEIDLMIAEKILRASLGEVKVHKFGNGPEAIRMLKNARKPGDFPGLIMVDMKMPNMDGEAFLQNLQQLKHFNPKKCCVMLISAHFGYRDGYDIERLAGDFPFVSKYLQKPLTAEMMMGN